MKEGANRPPFCGHYVEIRGRHGLRGSVHGWCTVWCTEKPQKTANVHGVHGLAGLIPVYVSVRAF